MSKKFSTSPRSGAKSEPKSSGKKSERRQTAAGPETPRAAEGTNVFDFPLTGSVSSSQSESKPVTVGVKIMNLTKRAVKGNLVLYTMEGVRGSVRFLTSQFAGDPPQTLTVEGTGFAQPSQPKSKMTKEERAAERAKLTPADKARAAQERANKAIARAQKLAQAAAQPATV